MQQGRRHGISGGRMSGRGFGGQPGSVDDQGGRGGREGTYTQDAEGMLGRVFEEGAEREGAGLGLGGGRLGEVRGGEGEDAVEQGLGVDAAGEWVDAGRGEGELTGRGWRGCVVRRRGRAGHLRRAGGVAVFGRGRCAPLLCRAALPGDRRCRCASVF